MGGIAEYVKETDIKSRIIGVKECLESFDFLFGLMLGQLLLDTVTI